MSNESKNGKRESLDQKRAKHAWKEAEKVDGLSKDADKDDYAREAKKLPMRIMNAGLGQALAYIEAKAKEKKTALKQLHSNLSDWVVKKQHIGKAGDKSLLYNVVHGDSAMLRRATDETLCYLQWLNRFLEAKGLPKSEGD